MIFERLTGLNVWSNLLPRWPRSKKTTDRNYPSAQQKATVVIDFYRRILILLPVFGRLCITKRTASKTPFTLVRITNRALENRWFKCEKRAQIVDERMKEEANSLLGSE